MAVDLTTIFGNEIKVFRQPRQIERQYAGYPGVHGLTTMHMGTRGYQLVIRGTLRATTRALCQAVIDTIEIIVINYPATDYIFYGTAFPAVIFDKFELIAGYEGKVFHYTAAGWVTAQFICYGRGLI